MSYKPISRFVSANGEKPVSSKSSDELRARALAYHRGPRPGKIEVKATKPLGNQHDLALAYTPGVAAASEAIAEDATEAASLTARANLVAVVTNGTAVLGLGAIGPLASKSVMEGKAVLFKKFAGIDVFDIEVDANDVVGFFTAPHGTPFLRWKPPSDGLTGRNLPHPSTQRNLA